MMKYGGDKSVVLHHDTESLLEGCLVVGCSHSFVKIIGKRLVDVYILHTSSFTFFHGADAPVEVCRESVSEVVCLCYLLIYIKGLVAD